MTRVLTLALLLALPSPAWADRVDLGVDAYWGWGFWFSPEGLDVNLGVFGLPPGVEGNLQMTAGPAKTFTKIYDGPVHTDTFYRYTNVLVEMSFWNQDDPYPAPPIGRFTGHIPAVSFLAEREDAPMIDQGASGGGGPTDIWSIDWRFTGYFDQAALDLFQPYFPRPLPRRGVGNFSVTVTEGIGAISSRDPDDWRVGYTNGAGLSLAVPEPSLVLLLPLGALALRWRARRLRLSA